MYLNNPVPLLVNSNPFYMFPKQNFRSTQDHLKFAAKVVKFIQEFRTKVEKETLPQDFGRGAPFCMQTYKHFFTSCRIPGQFSDTLQVRPSSADHFIVASRNQVNGNTFSTIYLLKRFLYCSSSQLVCLPKKSMTKNLLLRLFVVSINCLVTVKQTWFIP